MKVALAVAVFAILVAARAAFAKKLFPHMVCYSFPVLIVLASEF